MHPLEVLLEVIGPWPILLNLGRARPFVTSVLDAVGSMYRLLVSLEVVGGPEAHLAGATRYFAEKGFLVAILVFVELCFCLDNAVAKWTNQRGSIRVGRTLLAPGVPRGVLWWRRAALVASASGVLELEIGKVADEAPGVKGTPGIVVHGEFSHAWIHQAPKVARIIALRGSGCPAELGKAWVVVVYGPVGLPQFDAGLHGVPWGILVPDELVHGKGSNTDTLRVLEHHPLAEGTEGPMVGVSGAGQGVTSIGIHIYRPCEPLDAKRIR